MTIVRGRTELTETATASLRTYREQLIAGDFERAGMTNLSLVTKVKREDLNHAEFSALTVLAHAAVAYGDREDLTRAIRVYRTYANLGYYSADDLTSSLRRPAGHHDSTSVDDMLFRLFTHGPNEQFYLAVDRKHLGTPTGNHKDATTRLIALIGSDGLVRRITLIETAALGGKVDALAAEIAELKRSTG